jgi:hydrogenase maturation protease
LSRHHTLILGIGNTLLSDEGVGIHALGLLEQTDPRPSGVTFLDGGTLSFTLAEPIATHDRLIVIDAAQFGGKPAEIRCFEGGAMDAYLKGARRSAHEVGLVDLLDIARLSDTLPHRRALVGVQPEHLGWGEEPSPAVRRALPTVVDAVLGILGRWRAEKESTVKRASAGE